MTLLELAETVIRVTGSKSEIVFAALPMDDPRCDSRTSRGLAKCSLATRG